MSTAADSRRPVPDRAPVPSGGAAQRHLAMRISDFVRAQVAIGNDDPDVIAKLWLEQALESADPIGAILVPVRSAVGSAYSSVQAALRGARGAAALAGAQRYLTRQEHNEGRVYNPVTRRWVPLLEATVADFEEAIRWHQAMIAGHEATIAEYRRYITTIRDKGVTCLGELPEKQRGLPRGTA